MKDKLIEATILALQGKLNLNEAKPSALKKTKKNDRDIYYEPMEGQYEYVPFDYTLHGGDLEGYIMDKKGNKYMTVAKYSEEDSGRIAGGTTKFFVTIAYGEHKISMEGWHSAFSKNSSFNGDHLIDDLENGMYLEDYLEKYKYCINSISNINEKVDDWVKNNITGNNEDYDERTYVQKRLDKKNENTYVEVNHFYAILTEQGLKLINHRNNLERIKYKYTGKNTYSSTEEYITLPEDSILILDNETMQIIKDKINTNGKYDFEFTLNDFNNVTLEIDKLGIIAQINNNKLKPIVNKSQNSTLEVEYSTLYNEREGLGNCKKLDDLSRENNIDAIKSYHGTDLPEIYNEIQANLMQKEKRGVKGSIVEIVYDNSKKEYRAQGDDGYHGKAWVQFPMNLRQDGKRYKVDELIWNGKNYRAKGNIEEV